jgi:hypothetical protein
MEDTLFGAMTYDSRWVGRYSYRLFGKLVNVRLVVPCDEGDEIEPAQREAFSAFNAKRDELTMQAEAAIFTYYQNEVKGWRHQFGAESADRMAPVINQPAELASLIEATDIIIRRTYSSADRVIGLLFSCSWDPELGLAVKFLNEAIEEVGPQDIVL